MFIIASFSIAIINAAFTHEGLTTRYRTKSLHTSIFVLSRSRDIYRSLWRR